MEISVKKESVLEAYKQASEEQKKIMESLFGKDIFLPKEIGKCIKNFNDACDALGEDDELVSEYKSLIRNKVNLPEDIMLYHKLRIIIKARNNQLMPTRYIIDGGYYHPKYYIKSYDEEKKEYLVVKGWFLVKKE